MEDYLLQLIENCNNNNFSREESEDFVCNGETTKVWKIQSNEEEVVLYWNSSNGQEPQHDSVLSIIANELIHENDGGSFSDGFNEIMYEIK